MSARPIEGATVTLAADGSSLAATTGNAGQFSFARAGGVTRARITVKKPGYFTAYPGQVDARDYVTNGLLFDVAAGERLVDVVVRMWASSTITGQVADDKGAPIEGAAIEILTRVYAGTAMRWHRAKPAGQPTDERGMYRIEGLWPGEFILMVRPPAPKGADLRVIPPTYYPGSNRISSGSGISLAAGAVRTVDVIVDAAPKSGRVTGQLAGADRGLAGAIVHLAPLDMNGGTNEYDEIVTTAEADGRFQFARVPEGDYRLTVCDFPRSDAPIFTANGDFNRLVLGFFSPRREQEPVTIARLPDAPTWVADVPVSVESEKAVTLSVPLQQGAHLSGRVVFDGTKPKPTSDDLLVTPVVVRPADGRGLGVASPAATVFPQPRIERDGSFTSVGLPPGTYVLNVSPWRSTGAARLSGWTTSSITIAGHETIGTAIPLGGSNVTDVVLTLTDSLPELMGTVRDAQGKPILGARVIVFPRRDDDRQYVANPAPARVIQIVPDRYGAFRSALVPGEYFVVGVLALPSDWMSRDHLRSLEGKATAVRLGPGDLQSLTLTAR